MMTDFPCPVPRDTITLLSLATWKLSYITKCCCQSICSILFFNCMESKAWAQFFFIKMKASSVPILILSASATLAIAFFTIPKESSP